MNTKTNSRTTTLYLTRIALLSAMGVALMYLPKIPYIFPWMKFDFAEIPVILGALAMGPWSGVLIAFFKCALYLPVSFGNTFGVGVMSNFICGAAFSLVTGYVYKYFKGFKFAVIALAAGIIATVIVAVASNWFIVFPVYNFVMNYNVKELFGAYVIWAGIIPFNLIKCTACALIILPIYKVMSRYVLKGDTMFGIRRSKNTANADIGAETNIDISTEEKSE